MAELPLVTERTPWRELIGEGAAAYRRELHLARLGIMDGDTASIVYQLQRKLTNYHLMGINRHYSYDVNRHLALAMALKSEQAQLARETKAAE